MSDVPYNKTMTQRSISTRMYDSLDALRLMAQGARLTLARKPVLFRMEPGPAAENSRILVSGSGYTLRLGQDDFLELYAGESFIPLQERSTLDEKKDEEYYAWRAKKQ